MAPVGEGVKELAELRDFVHSPGDHAIDKISQDGGDEQNESNQQPILDDQPEKHWNSHEANHAHGIGHGEDFGACDLLIDHGLSVRAKRELSGTSQRHPVADYPTGG